MAKEDNKKDDVKKDDRLKALDAALSQIEKQYGKGSVMKLGDTSHMQVETVPTGSLSLDIALGAGGVPKGRIVEIYGPESSGKTTVALHMVAEVQKRGGIAGFIDAEHALDPVYARNIGVDIDIVEDGKTFEENAVIKAKAVMEETGEMVLADDSGFEVDYLNKEPGIYSARYLGEDTPYSIKNAEILKRCEGVPDEKRDARFVCVIACAYPDGTVDTATGIIEGKLAKEPKGENGFGYDPIFYLPERGMTTGEMEPEEKNAISHRGIAIRKMVEILKKRGEA